MNKPPFTLAPHEGPIGHHITFGPTSTGMGGSFAFNPFKEMSADGEDTVLSFLVAAADIQPAEIAKERAREIIRAREGKNASMLDIIQAFELVPELRDWAAKLRRNALPA